MSTYTRNAVIDTGVAALGFAASAVIKDGATTVTANVSLPTLQAAVDAAPLRSVQENLDAGDVAFIKAQFPAAVAKARLIVADPASGDAAHTPTAAQFRVAWALVVLDIAQRYR